MPSHKRLNMCVALLLLEDLALAIKNGNDFSYHSFPFFPFFSIFYFSPFPSLWVLLFTLIPSVWVSPLSHRNLLCTLWPLKHMSGRVELGPNLHFKHLHTTISRKSLIVTFLILMTPYIRLLVGQLVCWLVGYGWLVVGRSVCWPVGMSVITSYDDNSKMQI